MCLQKRNLTGSSILSLLLVCGLVACKTTEQEKAADESALAGAALVNQCLATQDGDKLGGGCFCYPNILPRLQTTLLKVMMDFKNKQGVWTTLRCQNLAGEFSETFGGWDIQFPQDSIEYERSNTPNPACGLCGRDSGNKKCYAVDIGGKSYRHDVWEINYALYGVLQGLCGADLSDSYLKIRAWKSVKGEWSPRVWYWFKLGYLFSQNQSSLILENILATLGNPGEYPAYSSCGLCPGRWLSERRPLEYQSYAHPKQ